MTGTVTVFDEHSGLGVVRVGDGAEYPFHCTQIAGGTRSIPAGIEVEFEVVPGRLGRWEAASVTPAQR